MPLTDFLLAEATEFFVIMVDLCCSRTPSLGSVDLACSAFCVEVHIQAKSRSSGKGSEGAWLLGICKRKVVDHVRRRNRPDAGVGGDLGPDPSEAMFDAKGHWRFNPRVLKGRPEGALEREEFWQAFRGCLQQLSQRQADAFTLRELDDLTSDEICKELEVSASNLWVLLHRARLSLTGCMKSHLEK
jgi:RNA polymerase sigma-70 factor (ECF subfamily)